MRPRTIAGLSSAPKLCYVRSLVWSSLDLSLLIAGGAGASVAVMLTPLVAGRAVKWSIVDRPDARKRHENPVALLGGVSVLTSLVIVGVAALSLTSEGGLTNRVADGASVFLMGCGIGALILAIVGLWDDVSPLPIAIKVIAQLMSSAVLLILWGPGGPTVVVGTAWLLLMTNSFNLLDNMDGSAPGVGAIAAIFLTILAGHGAVALVCAALAGALVGFLFFNRHPARVFLGDGGSLPIGFLLGAVGLWIADGGVGYSAAVLLVLGVPLLDTTLVVVSRLRRDLNPLTTPGTDHLSHRFVSLGLPVPLAVALLWVAGFGCGMAGLASAPPALIALRLVAVGVAVVWIGIIVAMERMAPVGLERAGDDSTTEAGGVS